MAKKQPKFIKKAPYRRKEPGIGYVIPFFAVLAVLTVVSFIIPLRPTVSYIEKRSLAEFPEFSVEALTSGDYFDDITTWFSDTFPGRETWLEVASYTKSFHGNSEIMIGDEEEKFDDPAVGDTEPPTEEQTEVPTETVDPALTEAPTEPPTIVLEEEGTAPAAPVEEWGGVDAGANEVTKSGTVIQIGDSLFTKEYFNTTYSSRYVAIVNRVAEKYAEKGVRVVSAAPPQAISVMVESEYMGKLGSADQAEIMTYFNENLSEDVYFVDTVSLLREHNDEYIYFRTDHHWTALGAYYVYEAICEQLDLEPASLEEDFELWDQGRFIGSLYYKAPKTKALKEDNVYAYNPTDDMTTRIYKKGGSSFEHTVLTDMSKSNANAKYMTFLAGDHPLVRIVNNDLPDAGNVLVIKDSFGNAMAPFFTMNYHKVYIVDYRYYSESMSSMIKSFEIDDVIFLPNVSEIQTKAVSDLLQKYKN